MDEKGVTPEVYDLAMSLMASLNCPRALTVAILIRYGEWKELVQLSTNPLEYVDSEAYYRAAQATDFLRKYPALPTGFNTLERAKVDWAKAEKMCFVTNRRLYEIMDFGTLNGGPAPDWLLSIVGRIRKIVRQMIGEGPRLSELIPRFGPGATVSDRSDWTTIPDKITSSPTMTTGATPFAVHWVCTAWARAAKCLGREMRYVRGNSFFTVPKDATKDRSCGKEPSLNVAYQLALGQAIRRRLKRRFGHDLDHMQERHRALAQAASRNGSMATIDLSMASDCVSTSLVEMLIPPGWLEYLQRARSPFTKVDGQWYKLEKFSSMGNGYTFELETVIFLAICWALSDPTADEVVSVFGDDLIVPSRSSDDVIAALRFFGFTVNARKTFTGSEFRESCGGDFFRGDGVRPYILDEVPHEPQDWISIANGIRRSAKQFNDTVWPRLRRTWFETLDRVPSHIRACRGPESVGDLLIHDEQARWRWRWRGQFGFLMVYRPARYKKLRWEGFAYEVQMASALYGVTLVGPEASKGRGSFIIPRDGVQGYKVGWLPFS